MEQHSCITSFLVLLALADLAHGQCTSISLVYGYAAESGQNGNNGFIENNRGSGNHYYKNETCGWQVTVTKGSTIRFVFQSVELENSTNCESDWVEVRDGFEYSKSMTGRICNASVVGRWFVTSDCVGFVYFQTNHFLERRGFTLYWEKVPGPESASSLVTEPSLGDLIADTKMPPLAMIGQNTTAELQHASFSLIISITTVVGVTFGIVLVVITGILICVVFPKKKGDDPTTDKITGNFEEDRKRTLRKASTLHNHHQMERHFDEMSARMAFLQERMAIQHYANLPIGQLGNSASHH